MKAIADLILYLQFLFSSFSTECCVKPIYSCHFPSLSSHFAWTRLLASPHAAGLICWLCVGSETVQPERIQKHGRPLRPGVFLRINITLMWLMMNESCCGTLFWFTFSLVSTVESSKAIISFQCLKCPRAIGSFPLCDWFFCWWGVNQGWIKWNKIFVVGEQV